MKNESRIEELLAESLRKQDQHSVLLTKLVESDVKQNELIQHLVDGQLQLIDRVTEMDERLTNQISALNQTIHKLVDYLQSKQDKLEERVKRLEDKFLLG